MKYYKNTFKYSNYVANNKIRNQDFDKKNIRYYNIKHVIY